MTLKLDEDRQQSGGLRLESEDEKAGPVDASGHRNHGLMQFSVVTVLCLPLSDGCSQRGISFGDNGGRVWRPPAGLRVTPISLPPFLGVHP